MNPLWIVLIIATGVLAALVAAGISWIVDEWRKR